MAVTPQQIAAVRVKDPVRAGVRSFRELLLPGLRIQLLTGEPILLLRGETIATAARVPTRRQLIDRLFSISSLKSLRLNWRKGEVRLEFSPDLSGTADLLAALASAMRGRPPAALPLLHEEVILRNKGPSAFEIRRLRSELTLWRVDTPSPRVCRLTHPLLRSDFVRKEVLNELGTLPDVVDQSLSVLLSGGDSLLVFVRPHRMDPAVFPDVLDPVLTRCLSSGTSHHAPKVGSLMVNVNLAVAPFADFLFPPLGIVNLALTALINLKYVPRAILSLQKGRCTVDLLYLTSAVLTMLASQYLPAALMCWLMRFWPRRAGQLYELHHSKFLARYRRRPPRVWVERDGLTVETRLEDLSPSSLVTLSAGDIVPGDGVVVSGAAQINERLVTGNSGDVSKSEGGRIYAGSRIMDGAVRIRINSLGADTAAERIALWHLEALRRRNSENRAGALADRAALPALLLGAVGFVRGGLPMAKAAIGPDYLTGPAVSERLSGLATAVRAANAGIVITSNRSLETLLKCDSIVFDDSVAWQVPATGEGSFAQAVLNQGLAEAIFFASGSEEYAAKLASRLGFDSFRESSSAESKRAYIAQRQTSGHPVVYVGDCARESAAAEQADLAISVLEPPYHQPSTASIALLFPDLMKVLQLRAIALEAVAEFKLGVNLGLAPNAVAVLGALFLASPAPISILLSNLGMLADYVRSGTVLRLAEAEAQE